jgi:hypothetical protein
MRDLARLGAGALAALVLAAPAVAQTETSTPSPAPSATAAAAGPVLGDVVIRTNGSSSRPNRWLWYSADGVARFEGILSTRDGRFRASVDPQRVSAILTKARVCTDTGIPIVPLATDPRQFRLVVRCPNGWRSYATFGLFGNPLNEALRAAVRDLEAIGSELAWKPDTGTAEPPDVPKLLPN